MKKNYYIAAGIVIIVIIVIVAASLIMKNNTNQPTPTSRGNTNTTDNQTITTPIKSAGNELEGTLKKSDDPAKGNLMLVTMGPSIYLNTSRDYSALYDKAVTVSIEGNARSFQLVDIKAK